MDPAVAYDTLSYEPILNTYETLVNYNGSNTATFVPTLATCVPGTPQCMTDYGSNMTGFVGAQPIYWTFAIDPAAQFYDPVHGTHWGVYPSDVMFSIARTIAFADLPFVGANNGWITAQSLLPFGSSHYDSGIHNPFNNTPFNVLSSMLVNDSTYCPALALSQHGCITFVANGGGSDWPFFLQIVADNLGDSVTPCGWFTAEGAGIPGWPGTLAANGDGSCPLPGGSTNTSGTGFQAFLTNASTGSNGTYWDSFEQLANGGPSVVQPNVNLLLVGSGPYSANVALSSGYTLTANPNYAQPSACGGGGYAQYTGYCDPAPGGFQGTVHVTYQPDDTSSVTGFQTGTIDFGGLESADAGTFLNLQTHGKLSLITSPTLSLFFFPYNLNASASAYTADGFSGGYTIPANFLSSDSARQLFNQAYPYATVQNSLLTVDGIHFGTVGGGPIPNHMGNYYPTNVSFPTANPDLNPSDVGGAAWWANQAMNLTGSPYYDPALAQCKNVTCVFPIAGEQGANSLNAAIQLWIHSIKLVTNNAIQPYENDLTFTDLIIDVLFSSPGNNPFPIWNLGWAPDYPDPTDYMTPLALPDATYTAPDALGEQLAMPAYDNVGFCGHSTATFANLVYWSHQQQILSECQGVAFSVSTAFTVSAGGLPAGTQRTLDYNLIEHILNALGLYTWFEQANGVGPVAPWIDNTTINQDPMIGGGGDQPWFHIGYVQATSKVTFSEAGLSASARAGGWTVTISGGVGSKTTTNATMVFPAVKSGSYTYTLSTVGGYYPYTPPTLGVSTYSGAFVVAAPTAKVVATHWTLYKGWSVVFNPNTAFSSGLPPNEHWTVSVSGAPAGHSLTGGTITIGGLANGTHHYAITAVGFTLTFPSPHAGTFVLNGTSVTIDATTITGSPPVVDALFTQGTYTLTFTQTGLSGPSWAVNLTTTTAYKCHAGSCALYGGSNTSTTGTSIAIAGLPNGTYNYHVWAPVGFHATVPTGTAVIHSHPLTKPVHFAPGALHVMSPTQILAPSAVGQRSREVL